MEVGLSKVAECPSCKVITMLRYAGVQEGCEEIPDLTIWNCDCCRSTVVGRRFLPRAVEAALVAQFGPVHVEV